MAAERSGPPIRRRHRASAGRSAENAVQDTPSPAPAQPTVTVTQPRPDPKDVTLKIATGAALMDNRRIAPSLSRSRSAKATA